MQNKRGTDVMRKDEMKTKKPKCVLTIQAPRHRCDKFKSILSPILRYFDPSSNCIKISEVETLSTNTTPERNDQHGGSVPRYHDNRNILSTPALAVMMFLQERGTTSAQDVQKYFKRYPWRVHHKIELQNKRSPAVKVGQQEFYSLSREYPLWSVCPVYAGFEHLRLSLFVVRFSEMVEFYRLITDSEMESTKPDFCLFPVCSEDDFQVMLCLKRSKHLRPFPLTRAYLSFKVKNIMTLKHLLRGELEDIAQNRYLIKDPDGNLVMLEDMNIKSPNSVEYENDVTTHVADVSCDVTSVKSVCGSHDSGRYSDSDQCASELEHKSLKKIVHFSDTEYEKPWIYHQSTERTPSDPSPKHITTNKPLKWASDMTEAECDLSFEDYYDEHSQRCYPGMVIAHARFIDNQCEQTFAPDDVGQVRIKNGCQQYSQEDVNPPTVTVTDCFGNVHNCIETVIYPRENGIDQIVPYHPLEGQYYAEHTADYAGQIKAGGFGFQGMAVPTGSSCWSRRQNEGQTCDHDLGQVMPVCRSDDESGSRPGVREGGCNTGGPVVSSGPWGWQNSDSEVRLREEVNKKRHVKSVYI